MQKNLLLITGILGLLAVFFGAFGAHVLADKLTAGKLIIYHRGIEYQFYHTLALLFIASMVNQNKSTSLWLFRASRFFVFGILFFSGSIYVLACRELLSLGEIWISFIGVLTPIGGMLLIIGWFMIVLHAIKNTIT
ncbi:MAG: DUF423 domain-containing protein [Saprospiraceae bacterium]|nr:DUF423 domain-containing protein [Saprospiraceae bacterium]